MWVLQLNDMRNIDDPALPPLLTPVLRAESKEELQTFMDRERVNVYQHELDGKKWTKNFKKDGPLEWFNIPKTNGQNIINVQDADSWAENARAQFETQIMSIPEIP